MHSEKFFAVTGNLSMVLSIVSCGGEALPKFYGLFGPGGVILISVESLKTSLFGI